MGGAVVLHGTLSGESWKQGQIITGEALFRAVPYENRVCRLWLTYDQLTEVINEQFAHRSSYTYNGIFNAQVNANANWQVESMRVEEPVKLELDRIPVIITSYAAAGGGGRFPVLRAMCQDEDNRFERLPILTREVLKDYLKTGHAWQPTKCWVIHRPTP